MNYVFKEKFQLADLVNVSRVAKRVVIFESDFALREIYSKELSMLGLLAVFSENPFEVDSVVKRHQPHLLVCGLDSFKNLEDVLGMLKFLKINYGNLPVVTYALALSPDFFKKLVNLGISSHLDRRFSRPADLKEIVSAILKI